MSTVLSTESDAYRLLEQARWGDKPVPCPHCGQAGHSRYLPRRDGVDRPTRTGSLSGRRVWKCAACSRQFSVLTGTVLAGTRIPIRTWVRLVQDLAAGRLEGEPTPAVAGRYGLTPVTARAAVRCLRLALSEV